MLVRVVHFKCCKLEWMENVARIRRLVLLEASLFLKSTSNLVSPNATLSFLYKTTVLG